MNTLGSQPKLVTKKAAAANTPGSRDSPVINTLGSLYSLVFFPTVSFFINIGELRLSFAFITKEPFWTQGRSFTNFKEHIIFCKGISF